MRQTAIGRLRIDRLVFAPQFNDLWVISHLCRFQVLNQGAQKRFLDYYEKLCVSSRMLALRTARIVLFLSV